MREAAQKNCTNVDRVIKITVHLKLRYTRDLDIICNLIFFLQLMFTAITIL